MSRESTRPGIPGDGRDVPSEEVGHYSNALARPTSTIFCLIVFGAFLVSLTSSYTNAYFLYQRWAKVHRE